jgi:serine phosphatase RsbU (regulator of sigma subunit)
VSKQSLPRSSEFDQNITQLELRTDQQRKSEFLNLLVIAIIGLHLVALSVMLIAVDAQRYDFISVGLSLILNLVVFYLNRRGHNRLAAHLLCHNFNLIVFYHLVISLNVEQNPVAAIQHSSLLALTTLLAGLLISPRPILGFAILNTCLIFIPYLIFAGTIGEALELSFPPIGFLYLLATVSWLYQKTVNQAYTQLSATQQKLVQSQLVQRDMEIARDLQRRLYPAPPSTGQNLTIACRSEPAQETSGDFYDFIKLSPHEWGIVVADVTGKSLAAALVMAMARSTLRSEAHRFVSPAMLLRRANEVLYQDDSVDQMITALYGILDTKALTFHFANAGHIYPILKHSEGVRDLELNGLPLKAMPKVHYQERAVQLQPGDQLILSTDGVVETMNPNQEMFGFERLTKTIRQIDYTTPQQILQEIWQAVETFRDKAEQLDDITLVIIGVGEETSHVPLQPQMSNVTVPHQSLRV